MLSDPRRFSRLVAVFGLIAAPLLVLAGMAATPWEDENTTSAYHDALAAHPDQALVAAMLLHFGFLLLLPASLGMMHLARGAAPKLAHVGGPTRGHVAGVAHTRQPTESPAQSRSWAVER